MAMGTVMAMVRKIQRRRSRNNFFPMAWFQKENKQYFFYEHDMHSHILPGLDDGVKTIEESVAIVKRMLALGVRRFSFTPHISFPSPMNTPEIIRDRLDLLKECLLKEGISLDVDAGAEYKVGEYMLELIERDNIASFQGRRVLIEHSFVSPSPSFEEVVFRLQEREYIPVLAHPERYPFYAGCILERANTLKNRGCKMQVNLLSFTGFYGKEATRGAQILSDAGVIDYLSGDIHSMRQIEHLEKFMKSKNSAFLFKRMNT